MAKEKKKPVMNKSVDDRTLYDELRIQERIEHMNKLCQKIAGMKGFELISSEKKEQGVDKHQIHEDSVVKYYHRITILYPIHHISSQLCHERCRYDADCCAECK